MVIFKVEFTWHMIEFIPVTIVCVLFTYGLSLIVSHVGVYFYDLRNILEFTLRFLFYLSPIMWSLEGRDIPFEFLLKANPMYIIISSLRDALIYGRHPDYLS
jgi:ABC-type polysaccharide/polyol phosphate export permease